MSAWEAVGKSDDWRTPKYVFDAMRIDFDLDVSGTFDGSDNTPARAFLRCESLRETWGGTVWMNPPFGKRNGIQPWLEKFLTHGDGVALMPDRTSAPWFQWIAHRVDRILFVSPKIRFDYFDNKDGAWKVGKSPGCGTALMSLGAIGAPRCGAHEATVSDCW